MDTPTRETSLAELLRDVLVRTEATELAEALAILEIARASDSGNIYLGALKRQLETMFTLQRSGGLSTEKKNELLDTVPGIVECAVRENRRHSRPPEATAASPREAERELEALKLLYFQRASKFVMKGEYEQALAEVERVFVVDPTNSIAKQYAQRVEQLIQQARKLAAAPEPASPGEVEAVAASVDDEGTAEAGPSTAWTDEFLGPVSPIPEHRPAATSSKQTIAFGGSLAESLASHTEAPDGAPVPALRRRSSRVLAAALIVLLMGGGTFALLTATGAESAGDETNALTGHSPQANLNAQAAGAMTAQQQAADPAGKQEQPAGPAQKDEPVSPAVVPPPAVTTLVTETPQRSAAEPKSLTTKRVESGPAETPAPPVSAPVAEPTPAVVEAAPAETPAFVPIEKQPEILTLEKPVFSPFVWKTGGEAQVVVRVLIDTDGNPVDTQVLKSTNSIFEAPVLEAVMKSKFAPAQMGQGPVSAWLTIPFKMKQPR